MTNDRKLIPFDRRRRTPDPARIREFAKTARLLQKEREESAEVVERFLRDTPRADWSRLAEDAALRNSGVLDRLSREVQRRLDRDPQEALALSNLATAIAETLAAGAYPPVVLAQIQAQAWKDRGQALAYVARYDEALHALDRAEAILEPFGTLSHDQATVRFTRATALQEVERFDESLTLLTRCQSVFHDHGDARLELFCGITHGMLLHRLKRFGEAREVYEALLPAAESSDAGTRACLHNNLGSSLVELREFEAANVHISQAFAILTELGRTIDAARTELAHGRLLVRKGDLDRGLAVLCEVRAKFLRHALVEEAGLCGLEIADTLLQRNDPEAAEALAREIVHEFTEAELNARAITALGYLTEAIAARTASSATIEKVRKYIRVLRKDPQREFAGA
jgi:tetratricopeptide (TPR) repeat protein